MSTLGWFGVSQPAGLLAPNQPFGYNWDSQQTGDTFVELITRSEKVLTFVHDCS
jgi:hypothetical protein